MKTAKVSCVAKGFHALRVMLKIDEHKDTSPSNPNMPLNILNSTTNSKARTGPTTTTSFYK